MTTITLPDMQGELAAYTMTGNPTAPKPLPADGCRVIYAAAHVVADVMADNTPFDDVAIDWEATLAFRRHLASLGLGIAEAMDTAQRGMGLGWEDALELIRRTREDLPDALVANGVGTDHLGAGEAGSVDAVIRAYMMQLEAVQKLDAAVILMASRGLARVAEGPQDYIKVYDYILGQCEKPVILHWLGEMFDPALAGYWGAGDFDAALETVLEIIGRNEAKVDGIKISLLDKHKEITMRRRLPDSVRMYTGDDFNYPELIAGDDMGYSHALLGIFDPLAGLAADAVGRLGDGDKDGFHEVMDPTVPLARHIFRAPTRYYKTGVVFLAWLNGFQDHFTMIGGAQSARSLTALAETFRLADACGVLRDPDMAATRMKRFMAVHGMDG